MEGNLRFKIDWASLQWEGNLPFLLCFTFVFEGKFPRGAYIRRGDLTEGFLRFDFRGQKISLLRETLSLLQNILTRKTIFL